jgi:hypothetical protein
MKEVSDERIVGRRHFLIPDQEHLKKAKGLHIGSKKGTFTKGGVFPYNLILI